MTVCFDPNGGISEIKNQAVALGESIRFPSEVYKEGKKLTAWHIVIYGHSYSVKPGRSWTLPSWKLLAGQNIVAYAQWK